MMDLATASRLVLHAAGRLNITQPDIYSRLKDVGLISFGDRIAFRGFVFSGVRNEGFRISETDIPVEEETTLQEIIEAVCAFSLPGDPTTGDDDV